MNTSADKIRNIAIIAHVDHGKTTLVDQLLKQSGTIKADDTDRVMDSDKIEKERGITILAKQTGVDYEGYRINIVDTPGHSDFGGEVERTLQMVEGFLLLVDAAEGVLPGTRFVLQKALKLKLKPIVMINKVDRKDADIEATENLVQDLFLELATDDSELEFPVLYGSGRLGFASADSSNREGDMTPLFEKILEQVPAPKQDKEHLQMLVTSLDHSEFLGPIAVGRIFNGVMTVGDQITLCKDGKVSQPTKITKIYRFKGLAKEEIESAGAGDIVAITGFNEPVAINATICQVGNPDELPYVAIDEPTVSMFISVNNSPFSGKEGTLLTSRHIKERLEKELRVNVALRVEGTDSPETFKISGRGQLHLGILIENMRREGFELQLSAPEVIYKKVDGVKLEPIEHVVIDIPAEYQGVVMENMGQRKAIMTNMHVFDDGRMRLEYEIPSRALFGFKGQFLTDTRGNGLLNFNFSCYEPYKGDLKTRTKGAVVSMQGGSATGFALNNLQERGTLFIKPGDEVYEGMIIGEAAREGDMDVNPCKEKKLTNMRASGSDEGIKLEPPKVMELETCMEWIAPDELIEVTPKSIRLRKKILRASMRK